LIPTTSPTCRSKRFSHRDRQVRWPSSAGLRFVVVRGGNGLGFARRREAPTCYCAFRSITFRFVNVPSHGRLLGNEILASGYNARSRAAVLSGQPCSSRMTFTCLSPITFLGKGEGCWLGCSQVGIISRSATRLRKTAFRSSTICQFQPSHPRKPQATVTSTNIVRSEKRNQRRGFGLFMPGLSSGDERRASSVGVLLGLFDPLDLTVGTEPN
jgi:hypothetical protein